MASYFLRYRLLKLSLVRVWGSPLYEYPVLALRTLTRWVPPIPYFFLTLSLFHLFATCRLVSFQWFPPLFGYSSVLVLGYFRDGSSFVQLFLLLLFDTHLLSSFAVTFLLQLPFILLKLVLSVTLLFYHSSSFSGAFIGFKSVFLF